MCVISRHPYSLGCLVGEVQLLKVHFWQQLGLRVGEPLSGTGDERSYESIDTEEEAVEAIVEVATSRQVYIPPFVKVCTIGDEECAL